MTNQNIIQAMLELQQKLNDETNGKGWEQGYTKEGKLIDFKRCIYMESAELIDSFAWKHWKNIKAGADWDNVYIELVDIWHFILSLLLKEYKEQSKETIASNISLVDCFDNFCKQSHLPNDDDMYAIIDDIEFIIHKCSGLKLDTNELLSAFFKLAMKCGLNLDKLYKGYIAKNVLNKFRQDHGYKEGRYKKIINGKEDNEILSEILENELDFNTIYDKLEQIYKQAQ